MSRFYKTADRNYVDDFVFDPNVNLAAGIIQKEDAEIKAAELQASALGDIKFDYDYDADLLSAIEAKKKVREIQENAYKEIGGDWRNESKVAQAIGKARRLTEDLVETGDIKKITENLAKTTDWKTRVGQATSKGEAEKYQRLLQNYYESSGGKGAQNELFDNSRRIVERSNYFQDYTDNILSSLVAEGETISTDANGGMYIYNTKTGTKELAADRIKSTFNAFMQANPDAKERAMIGEKEFGEKWFDADGNFSFEPGYELGDIVDRGLEALAYKDINNSFSISQNSVAMQQAIWAREDAAREAVQLQALVGSATSVSGLYDYSPEARAMETTKALDLAKEIYAKSLGKASYSGLSSSEIEGFSNFATENDVLTIPGQRKYLSRLIDKEKKDEYKGLYNQVWNVQKDTEKQMYTSDANTAKQLGVDAIGIRNAVAEVNNDLISHWKSGNVTYTLADIQGSNSSGVLIKHKTSEGLLNTTAEGMLGQEMVLEDGTKGTISSVTLAPSSGKISFIDRTNKDNNMVTASLIIKVKVEGKGTPIEVERLARVNGIKPSFDTKQEVGLTTEATTSKK